MECAFGVLLAFLIGFMAGALIIMSSWDSEAKAGIMHIGGKAYRVTPLEPK